MAVARVVDRWLKRDRKTRTSEYGRGKRWMVEWPEPGGNIRRESFTFKDAAEARRAEVLTKLNGGTYIAKNDVTVGDLWARYRATKESLAKSSRDRYDSAWTHHLGPQWANTLLTDVRATTVQEWLPTLRATNKRSKKGAPAPISPAYESYIVVALRGLMNFAVDDRLIASNPLKKVRARKIPPAGKRYLEVDQADALIEKLDDLGGYGLEAMLILYTWCRPGEAWGMQVWDYDKRRRRIRIQRDIDTEGNPDTTKTIKHRDVPVSAELAKRLDQAMKGKGRTDWIVSHPSGVPWTVDRWRVIWEKARGATGIADLDTYELRHTGISWGIHAGANVTTVRDIAGHVDAATTLKHYGHLWDRQIDEIPDQVEQYLARRRSEITADEVDS